MKSRTLTLANYGLYALVLFITSCRKESDLQSLATITKPTVAEFTLGTDGNNCTGVKLQGTYMSGIVMNDDNTAELQVNVTAKGSYSLTTATVNGISFSASGNFQKTGNQTVTLTASGKPQAEGEKRIPIFGGKDKCGFNVTFLPKAPPAVFAFEGAFNACSTPVIEGAYTKHKPLTSSNKVVLNVNVTRAGSYNITTYEVNGIRFSGSGVFTTTGTNIPVTLTGSGTPLSHGDVSFGVDANAGCSFSINVTDAPPSVKGIFQCKIDGRIIHFTQLASAATKESSTNQEFLMLEGYENDNIESYFRIRVINNDRSSVKTGVYDEKHALPGGSSWNYQIKVDYAGENSNHASTVWSTASNFPGMNNPPFTIEVTSITSSRIKGTFSGSLAKWPEQDEFKIITSGAFDLPRQ